MVRKLFRKQDKVIIRDNIVSLNQINTKISYPNFAMKIFEINASKIFFHLLLRRTWEEADDLFQSFCTPSPKLSIL